MHKTEDQIDKLLPHTIPIDTWILENIKFNMNNWRQKVPIGSKPITLSGDSHSFDAIEYYRDPTCEGRSIFTIEYREHGISAYCDVHNNDINKGLIIQYDHPLFFDKLESWIWNVRTVDYIVANVISIGRNLNVIRSHALIDKEIAAQKIGYLNELHQMIGRIDDIVRKFAWNVADEGEDIAFPEVDGDAKMPEDVSYSHGSFYSESSYDEVPF